MNPSFSNSHSETGDWVVVAKIVRPQGRNGEILCDLLTDFPERFAERKRLFLLAQKSPREIELERYWLHQGRIVFKLAGVDSINDAELLRGLEVAIHRADRAPLEEGAVYIDDLIGCELIDSRSGNWVGKISGVDRGASATPLLVIETGATEVLVPFVKAYRPEIDLAEKRMTMELPEGLLELNVGDAKEKPVE